MASLDKWESKKQGEIVKICLTHQKIKMVGEIYLSARNWAVDILEATKIPPEFSAGYLQDIRHLFLRRLEQEFEYVGAPLLPTHPRTLGRSRAEIIECHPFLDPYGNLHGANFCFGYGAGEYSFRALNYRNPYLHTGQPKHFVDKEQPLLLGNFAVGIAAPASSMWIFPPPGIQVAGVAAVATAKYRSVIMWLGVRYCREEIEPHLLSILDNITLPEPVMYKPEPTYAYGTVFSQQFVQDRYDLSPEEEDVLRKQMGYPPKGKPIRERILYEAVCRIFGQCNVIRRYRGRELEGLELDIWVPHKHLGIEYQGQQHFRRVAHWHGSDGFEKQKARDAKKKQLCKELGIQLLYFGPDDQLDSKSVVSMLRYHRIM